MTTQTVIATLNVTFSADSSSQASGNLKLELDDRPDGLNKGDTSFQPGDDVGYVMYKDDNVTVVEHESTAGGISAAGSMTKDVEEKVNFSNSDSGSLNYPPYGSVTLSWLGRSYKIDGNKVTGNSKVPDVLGSNLKMPDNIKVAGILKCSYQTHGNLYMLKNVPKDFDEAMIFAIGTYEG